MWNVWSYVRKNNVMCPGADTMDAHSSKLKCKDNHSHRLLWRFKNREKKLCILHLHKLCRSSTRESNENTLHSLGLKKEKSEAWIWSKEGRTGIWSAFHSFFRFFFPLMQFGSLQSHEYLLTLWFKLMNFTDKRLVFYERSMSHSHHFQLSPNSTCAKANPFSCFFSCKDLAICFLS